MIDTAERTTWVRLVGLLHDLVGGEVRVDAFDLTSGRPEPVRPSEGRLAAVRELDESVAGEAVLVELAGSGGLVLTEDAVLGFDWAGDDDMLLVTCSHGVYLLSTLER